jgi:hypothetical protein
MVAGEIICVVSAKFTDFFDFDGSSDQEDSDRYAIYDLAAENPWADPLDRRMQR